MDTESVELDDERLRERAREERSADHDVGSLFVERWSPRAMTGDPLTEREYLPLFEAARWAPSSHNNQHWRFLYVTPADDAWETFAGLPYEGNRRWTKNAGLLVVICSKTTYDYNGEPAGTHSFDTGAAWQNLALEGTRRGLAVHGLGGFDRELAREELAVPDGYDIEAMCAVGRPAPPSSLPEDIREREGPSDRKPVDEFAFQGPFPDEN